MNERPSRLTAIALTIVAIVWVSPIGWLISNAFDASARGVLEVPQDLSVNNFVRALSGNSGLQFLNSAIIAAGTATLTVVVAAGAAYPLSRMRIPGRNAMLWALVLMRMMPATGLMIPIFFSAQKLGLLNHLGIILALSILNLPFALLLLKNFFDTVPTELEEAAHVEGASLWQIITKIVVPMSSAGMAVVWFFTFTTAWNEFLLPLLFSRTEASFPMSVGLFGAFGRQGAVDYGFLAAYSIVYAVPAIAVYFLLRRNMNTGFAGVGVKG